MRLLRSWHRWLGLSVVPIFIVTCLSGISLVYQKNVIHLLVAPESSLPGNYDIDRLTTELSQLVQLPVVRPDALIKAPSVEEPYWWIRYPGGDKLLFRLGDLVQYKDNSWILPTYEFIRRLHIELVSGLAGEILLLYISSIVVALSISGIYLWWPMRRGFHWRWVLPGIRRIKLKSLLRFHSQSGIVVLPLLFLVTLTASVMMFQKVKIGIESKGNAELATSQEVRSFDPEKLAASVKLANATVKDSWPTYIRVLADEHQAAKIRLRMNAEWHPNGRTNVYVDLDQLRVTRVDRVTEDSGFQKLLNQMYPLHSSYGMPASYSIFTLIAGIGGVWMIVTGAGSWIRRSLLKRATGELTPGVVSQL